MNNKQTYDQIFIETFNVVESALGDDLNYDAVPGWDSIAHMALIAEIEESFNITMEIDDIIDFSSYNRGLEILTKYEIEF